MEGYIFNQVITLLSKTSSSFLNWIKYRVKVWSTLICWPNGFIQKILISFKWNCILWLHISFDSYFLTWRIGYVLYVHCPIPHLVGQSCIFENIIKYSARSHPRVPKNFRSEVCLFLTMIFSRLSFYFLNKRKYS